MSNEDHQDQERDLREHIVSRIRAASQLPKKQLMEEELQALHTAATRLDQLLKSAADADREALKAAAARLDQLLANIDKGKDVIPELKRRPARQAETE
jgi:hypothetical protein